MAMTIKDLRELIKDLPDNMEILEQRYSDAQDMELDSWSLVKGVMVVSNTNAKYGWNKLVQDKDLDKLPSEELARVKMYLFFHGN